MTDPLDAIRFADEDENDLVDADELTQVLRTGGYPSSMVNDATRLGGLIRKLRATGLLNTRLEILGEIRRLRQKMQHDLRDWEEGRDREQAIMQARFDRIQNPSPVVAHELAEGLKESRELVDQKMAQVLTRLVRRSRKFVFDSDACTRLGELAEHNPDLIIDAAEFVRPPFPQTWVELDLGYVKLGMGDTDEDSVLCGILFDDDVAYVAIDDGIQAAWMPLCWKLNGGETSEDTFDTAGIDPDERDAFLWGYEPGDMADMADFTRLRKDHTMRLFPPRKSGVPLTERPEWDFLLDRLSGMLPVIIASAMVLLRPSFTRIVRQDDGGGDEDDASAVKNRSYLAHTVVTIRLRQAELLMRVLKAVGEETQQRRRHEVRGHYCHNRFARMAKHEHQWVEFMPDHWECSVPGCNGSRWWRRAHERGDAGVGYSDKHYVVKRG